MKVSVFIVALSSLMLTFQPFLADGHLIASMNDIFTPVKPIMRMVNSTENGRLYIAESKVRFRQLSLE